MTDFWLLMVLMHVCGKIFRKDYGSVLANKEKTKLGKSLEHICSERTCFLISKQEWMVGMCGENACGFGFPPQTTVGHQYRLMNHSGWLQVRADESLMAPHRTGFPPPIIYHTALMNPKWEAGLIRSSSSNHFPAYICLDIFPVISMNPVINH